MHVKAVGAREVAALLGVIVGFVLLAVAGRWASSQARTEPPNVRAGMRLALWSWIASAVGAAMNGVAYYSETTCGAGPPGGHRPALCGLVTASGLLFVAAALMLLISVVFWPPWTRPWRLQLVRSVLGLGWLVAFALAFLATGFVFDT
jgi:hypothetical protein